MATHVQTNEFLFEIGETVYLKRDPSGLAREVYAYVMSKHEIHYQLYSVCGLTSSYSNHSASELTRDKEEILGVFHGH